MTKRSGSRSGRGASNRGTALTLVRIAKSLAEVTEARRFAMREPERLSALGAPAEARVPTVSMTRLSLSRREESPTNL